MNSPKTIPKFAQALRITMTGSDMRGKLSFLRRFALSRKTVWQRLTISEKSPHVSKPAQRKIPKPKVLSTPGSLAFMTCEKTTVNTTICASGCRTSHAPPSMELRYRTANSRFTLPRTKPRKR